MANPRLRDALNSRGLTASDVAGRLDVDPKTVERWLTRDRTPYPRYRSQLAALVGESEEFLWPRVIRADRRAELSATEMVHIYPRRAQVPGEVWTRLLDGALRQVDVLVYSGLFLPEQQPELVEQLCAKVTNGASVRLLMAMPNGAHVLRRGEEEGIGKAMGAKVRNALAFYQTHIEHGCVEIRLHDTTLYNSIFRFDDDMLVNAHVYGLPAAHAPVMHLRQVSGGELFSLYADSFERIWGPATPVEEGLEAESA
jgi:transcriptional regulator with XRE-family HTH domain